MYLKHLTVTGFKSFAKKSELEFKAPITAIVGPNGSGKSNIAEAFRFVLGEQSIKSMRGKKGEDLIFNGSDGVSRGNRASVSITLDNSKRVFPMDFDEIELERVVHRDGQNEYSINGSKVRLKDVQEMLASVNIGPTGHHIISQGEADRILIASPKEKREMIEDALGLKVYKYKKSEAERKLNKTKENIEQVELLRSEVRPHLEYLQRQMKKIEKALFLRKDLKSVYLEYLRREDSYIAFHYDRLLKEKRTPEKTIETLTQLLKEAKEKLAQEENNEKRTKLIEYEEELTQVRLERQDLVRRSSQLEGQINYINERIARIQSRANDASGPPIPYEKVASVVSGIEKMVDKISKQDSVSMLQRALQDVVHSLKTFLNRASEDIKSSTEKEEQEKDDFIKEKFTLDEELKKIETKEQKVSNEYDSLKKEIEEELLEGREAERAVFELMNKKRENEVLVERINQEISVLERDRDEFKRELQEAVTLIGRDVTNYFEYQIIVEGSELKREDIVEEDRSIQRERKRSLEKMKIRLEEIGTVDQDIEKEFKNVSERDTFLVHEINDLRASVEKLEALITELTTQLNDRFIKGVDKIALEFNRFFVLMFGGGEAKLVRQKPKQKKKDEEDIDFMEVSGEDEEQEEGIEIDVKLPNKRISGLDMLSGGERALTSIALIFAMSQVNPPLFVILDETDAALDEANSKRYGDMIVALAERSQLILITHNRETMSRAGILYGVTMGIDGMSKLLSIKFDEALAVAK